MVYNQFSWNFILFSFHSISIVEISLLFFLFLSFLSLQLHRHAVVVVNFISTLKIIVLAIGRYFVISSSFLPKDRSVTRYRPIVHTNLFKSNSSLPVMDDKYSFTRAHYALASLITSIESLEPPSFWYNLSNTGAGSFLRIA